MHHRGHYRSCATIEKFGGLHASCGGKTATGNQCNSITTAIACVKQTGHRFVGLCVAHWRDECEKNGWSIWLSRCANRRCDEKKLSLKQRQALTMDQLTEKLSIDSDKSSHHFHKTYYQQENFKKKAAFAELDRLLISHHHHTHAFDSNLLYTYASSNILDDSSASDNNSESWSADKEYLNQKKQQEEISFSEDDPESSEDNALNDNELEDAVLADLDQLAKKRPSKRPRLPAEDDVNSRPLKRLRRLDDQ